MILVWLLASVIALVLAACGAWLLLLVATRIRLQWRLFRDPSPGSSCRMCGSYNVF